MDLGSRRHPKASIIVSMWPGLQGAIFLARSFSYYIFSFLSAESASEILIPVTFLTDMPVEDAFMRWGIYTCGNDCITTFLHMAVCRIGVNWETVKEML